MQGTRARPAFAHRPRRGARDINFAAFMPFSLAAIVLVLEAIALPGGTAGWAGGMTKAGGWVTLANTVAAGYLATAILLNSTIGRDPLPLWPASAS